MGPLPQKNCRDIGDIDAGCRMTDRRFSGVDDGTGDEDEDK
jgi:hypothetical protein